MLVYLASPYSHSDPEIQNQREKEISSIGARLTAIHKIALFMPITQSSRMYELHPDLFGTTFKYWADIDYQAIDACSEVWVVMMDGWGESIGVQAEILYGINNNKLIKFIEPKTLKTRMIINDKSNKNGINRHIDQF